MDVESRVMIFEAPHGSDLYRQGVALREQILRKPLGLSVSDEELAEDAMRQHFCAVEFGARLLAHAEAWGAGAGFDLMIAHARVGAEGFYFKHGYAQEGEPFEEHTIPHVRVIKRLIQEA